MAETVENHISKRRAADIKEKYFNTNAEQYEKSSLISVIGPRGSGKSKP